MRATSKYSRKTPASYPQILADPLNWNTVEIVHGNGFGNKTIPVKTLGKNSLRLWSKTLATIRTIPLMKIERNLFRFDQGNVHDAPALYSFLH
jgi:hypothetical protein